MCRVSISGEYSLSLNCRPPRGQRKEKNFHSHLKDSFSFDHTWSAVISYTEFIMSSL